MRIEASLREYLSWTLILWDRMDCVAIFGIWVLGASTLAARDRHPCPSKTIWVLSGLMDLSSLPPRTQWVLGSKVVSNSCSRATFSSSRPKVLVRKLPDNTINFINLYKQLRLKKKKKEGITTYFAILVNKNVAKKNIYFNQN